MDGYARNGAVANGLSVRDRMRARAREQSQSERGPFLTPEWLDHSFVLPVSRSAEVTLPSPRTGAPAPLPVFERPPSPEVDFAAVVRRSDAGRRARIATAAGLTLAL